MNSPRLTIASLLATLLTLFASNQLLAQDNKDIDFDRLMQTDGITVVYLSPSMLSQSTLRFGSKEGGAPSLQGLIQSVSSIYIFTASDAQNISLIRSMFAPILKPTQKQYEQLFFVKEGQRTMRFVAKMKGNEAHDLYLLVDEPEEYVAISFIGHFTRKQIESAMQASENPNRGQGKKAKRAN
ncbi:DUF4252 domain-containing protein [Porphyromonas circumdentaria]|uniref:DUF4252 domain-containing protein n=1 Tax=Porphyromonas circumdentaria TaxID=29524 RepID=A0A1T4N507_9PORP|nr:DUF4252 domain-containing protein [Porphyromonas circumdentaria]MBB6276035.1 hypothetical protein [Porphyromonas circumdentaria]MDO4722425.1 DUF4252 domain-containing protein [Porphyromonas circumdentaria]SJZ74244.1 protein of unknown function [Porphyromonas circumdentaria]